MAGSAGNLGFSKGMFSQPIGTALSDNLGRVAQRIGQGQQPNVDLDNPAAMHAEAARQMRMGNTQQGMQWKQAAVTREAQISQEQARQAKLREQALAPVSANAAVQRQTERETAAAATAKGRAASKSLYDQLIQVGEHEAAEQFRAGQITPAAATNALRSRKAEMRSNARQDKQREQAATDRVAAMQATAALKKTEMANRVGAALNAGKVRNNKAAQQVMLQYGIESQEDINNLSDADIAVLNSIVSTQSFLSPADDSTGGFQWERPTEAQVEGVINREEDKLDEMIDQLDLQEDSFGDEDESGYARLVASATESLRKHNNMDEVSASRAVVQLLADKMQEGGSLTDAAKILSEELVGRVEAPASEGGKEKTLEEILAEANAS